MTNLIPIPHENAFKRQLSIDMKPSTYTEAMKRYNKTEKAKRKNKRYYKSEKGKAALRRGCEKYRKTPKGKAALRRYKTSLKGKLAQHRAYIKSKLKKLQNERTNN